MPFEEHYVFESPEDKDAPIWRYMDFTKFASLLETRSLYFSCVDRLNDPFEGSWPRSNVEGRKLIVNHLPEDKRPDTLKFIESLAEHTRMWNGCCAVNCWHMNDDESAAMWSLYLRSGEGIAVRSTYSRLRDSIASKDSIFIGKVKYIDYDRDQVRSWNGFEPLVHKRRSYEHEKELRALVYRPPEGNDLKASIDGGLYVPADLSKLIERVYLAPGTAKWFADLVAALIKRYEYSFPVVQSRMDDEPVF